MFVIVCGIDAVVSFIWHGRLCGWLLAGWFVFCVGCLVGVVVLGFALCFVGLIVVVCVSVRVWGCSLAVCYCTLIWFVDCDWFALLWNGGWFAFGGDCVCFVLLCYFAGVTFVSCLLCCMFVLIVLCTALDICSGVLVCGWLLLGLLFVCWCCLVVWWFTWFGCCMVS